jgi:hypothetical protein
MQYNSQHTAAVIVTATAELLYTMYHILSAVLTCILIYLISLNFKTHLILILCYIIL